MENNTDQKLIGIASLFRVEGIIKSVYPLGEGFINDSYIVETKSAESPDYLLQRKNKYVFRNVPGMMENIRKVTEHLKQKVAAEGADPEREALTLTYTKSGDLYILDEEDEYWAMCLLIKDHMSYENADSPELAYAGGRGIGKFQCMLSDFGEELVDTLPGFHNIKFRFEQWDEVLLKDSAHRKSSLTQEIEWIESRREGMLEFWKLIETGEIPRRITHNDTKISNILFDKENEVLCVIDLDTVLNSTVLNDFGDAIRSYANTGEEDEKELEKVDLDMDIFEAYTSGYLSMALPFLSPVELENLAFSAIYITFEQTLRFLMDYIDGDSYYRIKYPDHNLVRAHAQNKLLESMESKFSEMKEIVLRQAKALKEKH